MKEIITYQEGLDAYSANDTKIYHAILHNFRKLKQDSYTLGQNQFNLEGAEETVIGIHLTEGIPHIITENESDGEENEYSLTDDTVSQLDKLQLLSILEEAAKNKEGQ